jgi:ceramide glucosyltransferase
MNMRDPIQLLITLGMLVSLWYYLTSYFGTRAFFRKAGAAHTAGAQTAYTHGVDQVAPQPSVTILKPLKGLEIGLYENLASFCRQDYPTFQVVFGVADTSDPAVQVVRRLQATYPQVRIDLVVDGRLYGTNYKISNLINMYRVATNAVIVLADSDIRVEADYLQRLVAPLHDPKVGIVTCLYRAVGSGSAPSLVERLFINTDFAPSVLVANLVETRRYAFGASIALRRTVLDEIGGFLPLANYLADDYHLGNRVAARGYAVALSDLVVETVLGDSTWRSLLDHQLRWARTYRSSRPASYFALVLTHGSLWATLNLLYNVGSGRAALITAALYAVRMLTAARLSSRYLQARLHWYEVLLVPAKDVFLSAVWALAFTGDTVHWSGNEFRVTPQGEMLLVAPAVPAAPELAYSTTAGDHDPGVAALHAPAPSATRSSLHV